MLAMESRRMQAILNVNRLRMGRADTLDSLEEERAATSRLMGELDVSKEKLEFLTKAEELGKLFGVAKRVLRGEAVG
jgi:hypothetical protein